MPGHKRAEDFAQFPTTGTYKLALQDHFGPKTSVLINQFKFTQCSQGQGEPVTQYGAALKSLVIDCKFYELSDELVRDQLIENDTLTLDKAVKLAVQIEITMQDANILDGSQAS